MFFNDFALAIIKYSYNLKIQLQGMKNSDFWVLCHLGDFALADMKYSYNLKIQLQGIKNLDSWELGHLEDARIVGFAMILHSLIASTHTI